MKVVITGLPGAGKTALGKKLARQYGLRHIEADRVFWGLRSQSNTVFAARVDELTREGDWVYEGHLTKVLSTLLNRADYWVELKPLPSVCFYRMLRREVRAFLSAPRNLVPLRRGVFNALNWGTLLARQRAVHERVKHLPHFNA